MRFQLVPKEMTEDHFWRNYFYRVYLMKQTCEVSSLASTADEARAPPKVAPSIVPQHAQPGASPDTLNETTGLEDDAFEEEQQEQPEGLGGVNLADLGGEVDDEVSFGSGPGVSGMVTPVAVEPPATTDAAKDADEAKTSSATPSSNGDGEGVSSDNSWDKADVETETDMSEFELLKDDGEGEDAELEEGWEDEVNAMLEEDDDEEAA
jgi:hypothetical protein